MDNPESNAPETYTGPKTSPEGYPYHFALRGGRKDVAGEDATKTYVQTGAGGKPVTSLLYDGRQFPNAAAIAEHKRLLVSQGYTTAHADTDPDDVAGVGYPTMTKAEADVALKAFDAAKSDKERFALLTPRMVHALQNRGWRRAAIAAAVQQHGGTLSKPATAAATPASTSTPPQAA